MDEAGGGCWLTIILRHYLTVQVPSTAAGMGCSAAPCAAVAVGVADVLAATAVQRCCSCGIQVAKHISKAMIPAGTEACSRSAVCCASWRGRITSWRCPHACCCLLDTLRTAQQWRARAAAAMVRQKAKDSRQHVAHRATCWPGPWAWRPPNLGRGSASFTGGSAVPAPAAPFGLQRTGICTALVLPLAHTCCPPPPGDP